MVYMYTQSLMNVGIDKLNLSFLIRACLFTALHRDLIWIPTKNKTTNPTLFWVSAFQEYSNLSSVVV